MENQLIFQFNPEKNAQLKEKRGVCFEDIIFCINQGNLIDVVEHHNQKYKGQKFYVVNVNGYIHLVPFVRDGHSIFLKPVYPSRKATKKYLLGQFQKNEDMNHET